jgi:hypothetical protein
MLTVWLTAEGWLSIQNCCAHLCLQLRHLQSQLVPLHMPGTVLQALAHHQQGWKSCQQLRNPVRLCATQCKHRSAACKTQTFAVTGGI